jgi:hypothetical protein
MAEKAEKVYEVLPGKKYTGKHKVYHGENKAKGLTAQRFKESELFGDVEIALNGSKKHEIEPVIKLVAGSAKKAADKK